MRKIPSRGRGAHRLKNEKLRKSAKCNLNVDIFQVSFEIE